MKLLVVSDKTSDGFLKRTIRILEEKPVSYITTQKIIPQQIEDVDMVLVVGGDKDILSAFHQMDRSHVPVLGVSCSGEESFLTEVAIENLSSAIVSILNNGHWIEEGSRIDITVDSRTLPPALNEAALFSTKSGTLIEYVLMVDNEFVWRDYSDGIIVATPIGSTAYSMSAGGPMVLTKAEVFVIVSVNSVDITRRPIIVSDRSNITIGELTCAHGCELIVDGTFRVRVKESVEVKKCPYPARLVRLPDTSVAADRITRKVRLAEELLRMPPSAKLILKTLQYEGPMSQKDLVRKTMLPERTARLALSLLLQRSLVKRRPLLRDARQKIYSVSDEKGF